ncbi:MAG: DUF2752 domain-containing protein [Planctomycetota bacterium]|jgi:hypothetical protein
MEGKLPHVLILSVCVVVTAGSVVLEFEDGGLLILGLNWPMRCPLYDFFGVKCALCGLTRSLCFTAEGQLGEAFGMHSLGPVIFLFICVQIPYRIAVLTTGPKKVSGKIKKTNMVLTVMVLTAIFVNWLIYIGGLLL